MVTGNPRPVVIGTRGSALARRQTDLIVAHLHERFPALPVRIRVLSTVGDRVPNRPITELGDKGVFVRSIEGALLDGHVDLAVHSLKDVPSDAITPGLELAAFSTREDPRDVIVARPGEPATLAGLPAGARVGTSSQRRRVQLRAVRPDLPTEEIRGNIDTRLRKLEEGQYDALILAAAGLKRVGLEERIGQYLPVEEWVPDAGQGIMVVQARTDDEAGALARHIDDPASRAAAQAERALVRALNAGCHSPVGAYARLDGSELRILGMAATEDGCQMVRAERSGSSADGEAIGRELGRELLRLLRH